MSVIHILDENISNIIAAGEVVENPASMLKELYENSIDAKSTSIIINIDSKLSFFKITDNGFGMSKEDVYLSIERHATSKINKKEDVFNISTLGFRGEALASISSISKLTLSSKREDDKTGHKITVYGGNIIKAEDFAMKTGTIIEIRDLFYNTPARKKFLKKEQIELTHIKDILMKLALSNPNISTTVYVDEKIIIKTTGTGIDNTVFEVLGKNIFKNLRKFEHGYLGNEEIYRSSRNYIYTFINSRYTKSNIVERAVIDAYYTKLMKNKYPFAIIFFDLPNSEVDVNVHPSKKIVKFSNEKFVYRTIRNSIEEFFYKNDRKLYENHIIEPKNIQLNESSIVDNNLNIKKDTVQSIFSYDKVIQNQDENNFDIITQVFDTYIVVRNKDTIDFYDQHAMHERIKYESLKDKYYNQTMIKKQLLIPELIELSILEKDVLMNNINIFEDFMFEIDEISDKEIILRAVPDFEFRNTFKEIIKSIIESLIENKNITDIREKIIISLACRSSIMAGQKLSLTQMQELVRTITKLNKFNCPHGRPIISKIDKDLLDKMAKRKL